MPDVVPGESARLGVWVLDGDASHASLLKHVLSSSVATNGGGASVAVAADRPALDRHVVLLCASMAEPGAAMESLQRWARALERHLATNDAGFDNRTLKEAREKRETVFD